MKIAVLGVTGMLGHTVFRRLSELSQFSVFGTARASTAIRLFPNYLGKKIIPRIDAEQADFLVGALRDIRPDVVINCIGLVKQLPAAQDPLNAISINSILPHRLARLCDLLGARLLHVSTDGVFSGRRGHYSENDSPDADDLYGRSKLLGELDYPNTITLRTSLVGPELSSSHGLIEWLMNQRGQIKGFANAIFSGLTTDEFAQVIASYVIPHKELSGVYHVGGDRISKYDLLQIVRQTYNLPVSIERDTTLVLDRSLDCSRFQSATGYSPPSWPKMILRMHEAGVLSQGS